MNQGWIKLHRTMLDNPIVTKDSDYMAVWIYLLLNATHTDYDINFGNKRITLKPGQIITGRKQIAKSLNINESKVQRIIKRYENEQQIEQLTDNYTGSIITIVKWNQYQADEQQFEQHMNNIRTTSEQHLNTKQECKNVKNVRNNIVEQNPYKEIIDYLNQATGSNYGHNTEKTKQLIKARMNEGQKVEDFKKVIDNKVKSWKGTEWEKYLRPVTLFGTKFEGYKNEKPKTSNNQSKNVKKQKPQIIEDETSYEERQAFIAKKLQQKIPIKQKNREMEK